MIGILGVASLVSRLVVGAALTRYSEKSVMALGSLLSVFAYLSYMVFRPFWPFLAMRFMEGVAFACMDTAILAFVVKVVPRSYRGQAIGYILLAPPLAMAISSSSGAFVANRHGFAVLFLSCAGLSLCSMLFTCLLKGARKAKVDEKEPGTRSRALNVTILVPAVITFLNNFVIGAMFAFTPLYAITCGISNAGPFFSAIAAMLVVCRAFGGRILSACRKESVLAVFMLVLVSSLVVLTFARTLPWLVVAGSLWGIGIAFANPASMAYALEYAASSGGPAVGSYQAMGDLGTALGPVTMGAVVSFAGYRGMFLCLILLSFANTGYFLTLARMKRRVAARSRQRLP